MSSESSTKLMLFSNIKYVVTGEISEEVKSLLQSNGAERYYYFSDYLTHCIVGDDPCEVDVSDAVELYEIPAVTQEWVTYSCKCNKLLPTSAFKGGVKTLFTGVVASFSKLSQQDCKNLWAMLKFYGGSYSTSFNKTTTHLIVSKPEGCKYEQALKFPQTVCVVTPDWLVDCVRSGLLLDEVPYHPRLLIKEHSPTKSKESRGILTVCPWKLDGVPNSMVTSSSKPLEEPKHLQPWKPVEKSDYKGSPLSKPLEKSKKVQPWERIEKSNGKGSPLSKPLVKPKQVQPWEPIGKSDCKGTPHLKPLNKHKEVDTWEPVKESDFMGTPCSKPLEKPKQVEKPWELVEKSNFMVASSSKLREKLTVSVQSGFSNFGEYPEHPAVKSQTPQQRLVRSHSCCKGTYPKLELVRSSPIRIPIVNSSTTQIVSQSPQTATQFQSLNVHKE